MTAAAAWLFAVAAAIAVPVGASASALAASAASAPASPSVAAAGPAVALSPCRVAGIESEVECGVLRRPLDPARPQARTIEIHFVRLPALAQPQRPDPIVFLSGSPGQGALDQAATVAGALARLNYRRDVLLVDSRGTGRSAPLNCPPEAATRPLAEQLDLRRQEQLQLRCLRDMQKLPLGDLKHYTTSVAMQDLEALRQALAIERLNLIGVAYGTRAALEYQRQYPARVRRLVLEGAAPPDTPLPVVFPAQGEAALDGVLAACWADEICQQRYPALRLVARGLLRWMPRQARVAHPLTGVIELLQIDREMVLSLLDVAMYTPALASALPSAIALAHGGQFEALVRLAASHGSARRAAGLAPGAHFAVVCAEDGPRLQAIGSRDRRSAGAVDGREGAIGAGANFEYSRSEIYRRLCAALPAVSTPEPFYSVPEAPVPALLLSGGGDRAAPPGHAARLAQLLGAKAKHVVVAGAGVDVGSVPCARDLAYRFIFAEDDAAALAEPASCGRPPPAPPIRPAAPARPTSAASAAAR